MQDFFRNILKYILYFLAFVFLLFGILLALMPLGVASAQADEFTEDWDDESNGTTLTSLGYSSAVDFEVTNAQSKSSPHSIYRDNASQGTITEVMSSAVTSFGASFYVDGQQSEYLVDIRDLSDSSNYIKFQFYNTGSTYIMYVRAYGCPSTYHSNAGTWAVDTWEDLYCDWSTGDMVCNGSTINTLDTCTDEFTNLTQIQITDPVTPYHTYVDDFMVNDVYYSGEFAGLSAPTVPSGFNEEPYLIGFNVTCTEDLDLTYYVERENGLVDQSIVTYRVLEEDCEVDDIIPVSVTVPSEGTYHFYFQHVESAESYSDYSTVDVVVDWEYYTPSVPVLEYPSSATFTTSTNPVNLIFSTDQAGYLQCVNETNEETFNSAPYALNNLEHELSILVDLETGSNTIDCYLVTQEGTSSTVTVTATLDITGVPILIGQDDLITSRYYRMLIDISEDTVNDLFCKIDDDVSFTQITGIQSTDRAYWDIDMSDIQALSEFTRFSFDVTCYFDDGVETNVVGTYSFSTIDLLQGTGSLFCSSLNTDWGHLEDSADSAGKKWYLKLEKMFVDIPLIGDGIFLNCYLYNSIFQPLKAMPDGLPQVYTPDAIDMDFSEWDFTLDLDLEGLHTRASSFISDIDEWDDWKNIATAILWIVTIFAIGGLFFKIPSLFRYNDPFNSKDIK